MVAAVDSHWKENSHWKNTKENTNWKNTKENTNWKNTKENTNWKNTKDNTLVMTCGPDDTNVPVDKKITIQCY
ncbi:hypothetical protein ACOMHN_032713 [Nucella lapillus]